MIEKIWRRVIMHCDLVIIGAGPAGIFTALQLLRRGSKRRIVMVEKGAAPLL